MLVNNLADELCKSLYITKNIYIEGDKNGFNSKMAIEKFRISLKKMDFEKQKLDLEELKNKYIKSDFILEIIKYDTTVRDITIKISEIVKKPLITNNKKILKDKLNAMRKNRNKVEDYKCSENVSDDILKEYIKLKKISKMPIPEPNEILSNPEQYKPILSMVLNTKMVNQMGINHPYIRYFKLIAQKLNFKPSEIPQEILENVKQELSSNKLSNNDDDTDEED